MNKSCNVLCNLVVVVVATGCCNRVSVECWIKSAVCRQHPGVYTKYLKDGTLNGHVTYTSEDGGYAISFIEGRWWIQRRAERWAMESY